MENNKEDTIYVGDIVEGTVTGIKSYGVFLLFDNGTTGLVHISELSSSFVNDTSNYATIGNKLKVKVIGVDNDNHYKLSIKQLHNDNNVNKKVNTNIKETSMGFKNLGCKIDEWISDFSKKT